MCGALKRARLIHPGVAEVVFVKKDDAITAYKKYNNRCLDGKSGRKQPPLIPSAHDQAVGLWSKPPSVVGGTPILLEPSVHQEQAGLCSVLVVLRCLLTGPWVLTQP